MYYERINEIVKIELNKHRKLAIFPYGKIGMQARDIIVNRYGQDVILIDNNISQYNTDVISLEEFYGIDSEEITIILCTSKAELLKQFEQQINNLNLKASIVSVIQLAITTSNREYVDEKNKQYCILQRCGEQCGLFSHFIVFLSGINYCVIHNRIPVIDMRTYDNLYKNSDQNINSWELFFKQPMGIGIDQIANAEVLDANSVKGLQGMSMELLTNEKKMSVWRKLCKKYIKLTTQMEEYVTSFIDTYIGNGKFKKTVGVLCRGTDYISLRPKGHPIQPDINDVIEKTKDYLKWHECNYVFLATEDKKVYELFREEFKEKLLAPNVQRFQGDKKEFLAETLKREGNINENSRQYLATIYTLAKCKCLIGGRTSGSVAALILSEGYEDFYLYNLGYYGIDD